MATKHSLTILLRLAALAYASIRWVQRPSRVDLATDKLIHYDDLAALAQVAASDGDMRTTFKVVKKLGGFTVRGPKVARLLDRSLS